MLSLALLYRNKRGLPKCKSIVVALWNTFYLISHNLIYVKNSDFLFKMWSSLNGDPDNPTHNNIYLYTNLQMEIINLKSYHISLIFKKKLPCKYLKMRKYPSIRFLTKGLTLKMFIVRLFLLSRTFI